MLQSYLFSLKKNIGDRINVDIDENGDLTDAQDISGHHDLSLPQEPDQVQVVHTQDQTVNRAKNANQVIADQARMADEIANQQAEIVYKDEETERPEDDEETYLAAQVEILSYKVVTQNVTLQ